MMKSSKSTTALSSASASGTRRLQPLRTTRNNSSRVSTAGVRSHASKTSLGTGPTEAPIEIFPAITHFADAISALPKEIVRHFTLLKEVDAKIFLPEEELMKLVNEALNAPLPPRSQIGETHSCHGQSLNPKNTHGNISGSYINGHGISTVDPDAVWDPSNISRRQLFNKCALTMQGMLVSLDEKNHVISTAGEALAKQLVRIDDCLPFIELEVSEEARNGSTTHWAYPENRISKANSNGNLRREPPSNQSSTGAQNLADEAAARSDARKQAILEKKKSKNLHVDSDFDDQFESKNKDKKTNPKARKQADTQAGLAASTINGSTPNGNSSKRRKVEKTSAQSPAIERSANSNPNINGIAFKGKPASPKSTPQPEGTRKRPRTTQTSSSGPLNKKRNNIEVSGAKSPPLDSSPVQTNFPNSQAISKTSPPPISSRPSSARCSQNSIQRNLDKQPPSPSHNKLSNDLTPDSNSNKVMTASSLSEAKAPSKKVNTSGKSDRSTENVEQREAKISDSIALSSKGNPPPKRDLLDGKVEIHPALSTLTITTTKSGRTSKPSTPATPIFPEFTRPRASRNLDTSVGKRSHKKGAGVATQQFPSHYTGVDDTGKKDNEISEDADIDANEPRYCYCNNVSYGEMVGCDSERCKREWFHLACVGLKTAPRGNTKWYCEDCKLL